MDLLDRLEPEGEVGGLIARGDPQFVDSIKTEVSVACMQSTARRGSREHGGQNVFFKYGRLRGKSRLRHAARWTLWRVPFPHLNEFDNLHWLRTNGFDAPVPLAAGVFVRSGLPFFQFLFTQEVAGGVPLADALRGEQRGSLVVALGNEVARLHGRGFVHRDLFARNLLVTHDVTERRIHFLDCWRGGPRPGLRGPTYDVACLMLDMADQLELHEQRELLDAYFGERARLGHRVSRDRFLSAVARQRERLALRHAHRRREVLPVPSLEWMPEWPWRGSSARTTP